MDMTYKQSLFEKELDKLYNTTCVEHSMDYADAQAIKLVKQWRSENIYNPSDRRFADMYIEMFSSFGSSPFRSILS